MYKTKEQNKKLLVYRTNYIKNKLIILASATFEGTYERQILIKRFDTMNKGTLSPNALSRKHILVTQNNVSKRKSLLLITNS